MSWSGWYQAYFLTGPLPANAIHSGYNIYLIVLSYIIATLVSYVALDMSAHLRKPNRPLQYTVWLLGSAFVMSTAIWSVHFVSMLAVIIPLSLTYAFSWTASSLLVALFATTLAFLCFRPSKVRVIHYLCSGIILGITIPTMHFIGMMGMNGVKILFVPCIYYLAILFSCVGAALSIWLSLKSDQATFKNRLCLKLSSALIMGLAISSMLYSGLRGVVFTPVPGAMPLDQSMLALDPIVLAIFITTIITGIMIVALILSTTRYILSMQLKTKNAFLMNMVYHMRGGVIGCDSDGKIVTFNHTAQALFGPVIAPKDVLKEWINTFPFYKPQSGLPVEPNEHPLYLALKGEYVSDIEYIVNDLRGKKHILLIDGQPLITKEKDKLGAMIIWNDISKRTAIEEALKFHATHDILTGLPNRFLLRDRLNQALMMANRKDSKVTVIFMDLDNFKFINDALGYLIGDTLLKTVALRFKALLRTSDTVARVGGDEFVIILPDQKTIESVPVLLKKILYAISEPYNISGQEINITCSLGFSVFPDDGPDADTLLKNADTAMFKAKENGRNTFQLYTQEMQSQVKKRLDIENGLRKALLKNEFFLQYQPKLDLKTNKLIGVEALVRWQHPERGTISPNVFVPIAEDTGLIVPIGKWVLETACRQNKAWQQAGLPPICISVNLSSRQCKDKNLLYMIKEILEETELNPEYLELELTESISMANPTDFVKLLAQIKELGLSTSIDDFGTGYSSLNYLRQFTVNRLKIDMSFIKDLEKNTYALSIVKAIISLGHSLDLKVIAEGVETKNQLKLLKDNDCDEIQGYYFSHPLAASAIPEFFKDNFDTFLTKEGLL